MQLSNKGKIVLILLAVLIIAFVVLYFVDKNNKTEQSATESPTSEDIFAPETTEESASPAAEQSTDSTESIDQIIGVSPTSTATSSVVARASVGVTTSRTKTARTPISTVDENGVRTYKIAITPAPNAGKYDWTRHVKELTVIDGSKSEITKQSLCETAGFSNSWSNAVEKITCDLVNFVGVSIAEQLSSLTCAFHGSALQENYKNSITYEYKNGACFIIDR